MEILIHAWSLRGVRRKLIISRALALGFVMWLGLIPLCPETAEHALPFRESSRLQKAG